MNKNIENYNKDKKNNKNNDNKENDKVKIRVSSLKEDTNIKPSNDNNQKRIGFFKSLYYSTIRIDKLDTLIINPKGYIRYILILLIIASLMMSFSIASVMGNKMKSLIKYAEDLPEFEYKDGIINAEINTSFVEKDINRLIIINTIDSTVDIREEYKKEIDNVDHYLLFTKDTIYAEPGESIEYSAFNFLTGRTIVKDDLLRELNFIYNYKFVFIISGFIVSAIVLGFISIFSFFVAKLLITILTFFEVKTISLKEIDRMTIYLMSGPIIAFTLVSILEQLSVFKLPFNTTIIYSAIYLIYILIAVKIIKDKFNQNIISKKIEFIEANLKKEIEENRIEDFEREDKIKKEKRRKLKDKTKKEKIGNKTKEKDDEVIEGV